MKSFWPYLAYRFEEIEPELNRLDAATGDGDHGSTMLKGFRAAAAAQSRPARAFRAASGGAGGTLFGFVVSALEDVIEGGLALDEQLGAAADRIREIGQSRLGDKTMLDALVPASAVGPSPANAAEAAKKGLESTRAMAARSGRAKYVEGAGVGHLDAGARSVAEILTAFAKWRESGG